MLTLQICGTGDLQCLFVLLLRRYNPSLQSKQYLQDVIVTNHVLLLLLDEASKYSDYMGTIKMLDHIEQFATVDIMYQYGILLADFEQNGEFVNDCIFTMMHHIGGDIGQVAVLFQPTILKIFSKIFETEYELCDVSIAISISVKPATFLVNMPVQLNTVRKRTLNDKMG